MKEYLLNYANNIYPFHMPGHKLGRISPIKDINVYNIDVTEVEGTDNLHQPTGIIKEAQDRAKQLYNTRETFFLVNGSSSGILSAISACCKQDGEVLIARNSHKSISHAVLLNRLNPIYLYPEYIDKYNLLGGINPNNVLSALENNPDISCVVITSPTFEGFTSDIRKIAEIVHSYGKLLIVDEAHGAHFPFHNMFPESALNCDADVVIQSVHKTLPSLTQTALLHVNSKRVDVNKIKEYLAVFQTTSPSYILMSSIDECMRWIEADGETAFAELARNIHIFRDRFRELVDFKVLGREVVNQYHIKDIDLSKLVIVGNNKYIKGKDIDKELRNTFNIQMEMATSGSLVAITTVADNTQGFDNLFKAFQGIDGKNNYINNEKFDIINETIKVISPYSANQSGKEEVKLGDSVGRICGQYITLYPPGIPILTPGEMVTQKVVKLITSYLNNDLTVMGIDGKKISVVK